MKIRIIGCGSMGSALASGLSKKHEISVYDKKFEKAENVTKECGAIPCYSPLENFTSEHLLLLAVKPQDLVETANMLGTPITPLLISVLAGTSLEQLRSFFPAIPLLRIMPNLAVRYGGGLTALIKSPAIKETQIEDIFSPLGKLVWLEERKIDAFASLTACGPAFIYDFIEGMMEASLEMGFLYPETSSFIQETFRSALLLWEKSGKLPSQLKEDIAPPGGMTAAGLAILEERNAAEAVTEAFMAAYKRASELNA